MAQKVKELKDEIFVLNGVTDQLKERSEDLESKIAVAVICLILDLIFINV